MARKGKVGIDYFSHDVDMLQDKKIKIIKAKHGLIGYAVYLRLLEEIYRETGYYLHVDEDFNILFSDDNNIQLDVHILILNDCIEKGLFNKRLYEEYSILTSDRIQMNYYSATERRKEVEFYKQYLLINASELYNTDRVNVNILDINADILEVNASTMNTQCEHDVSESTQSKVNRKKSKVDNSKLNNINTLVELYKTLRLPKFNKLTEKRRSAINARVVEYDLETAKNVLIKADASNFLKESLNTNWYNFDWLFNPNNFVKILEDKYNNEGGVNNGPNQGHRNEPNYDEEPEGYEGLSI